ncbi:hypothetical protein KA005_74445 [bacterium]|nr:hypothetical protein [bacterium]
MKVILICNKEVTALTLTLRELQKLMPLYSCINLEEEKIRRVPWTQTKAEATKLANKHLNSKRRGSVYVK